MHERTRAYFPHVDGLRALAVLSVIAYHLHPSFLPGGFAGVDVFFVISGFVVSASLAADQGESRTSFLVRFYARRLARIGPALLAMLLATTAVYVLLVPRAWLSLETEKVALTAFWGVSNWILGAQSNNYFEPRAEFNPYTHTWSLGVEEQFYLIAPLLLFSWLRWRTDPVRRVVPFAVLAALAAGSLVAFAHTALHHGQQSVFYLLLYRFWELAAGVLWYQWAVHRATRRGGSSRIWKFLPALGLALVFAALGGASSQTFPWPWAVATVIGTALLIGDPNRSDDDPVRRLFSQPVLVWIGQRSYSLYLWHWPVFVLFRWTVGLESAASQITALALAVALSFASYRWIEWPFRFSPALKRIPAGVRVVGFLLLIGACTVVARGMFLAQPTIGLSQVTRNGGDWYVTERMKRIRTEYRICEPRLGYRKISGGVVFEYVAQHCGSDGKPKVFVLGDSHATAYRPLFDQLSGERGQDVFVYDIPGCPYIDLIRPMSLASPHCVAGQRAAMQDVLAAAKRGDIVVLPSLRLPRRVDQWGAVNSPSDPNTIGDFVRSREEVDQINAAAADAPRWFEPFLDAGMAVVFEAPKPIFRAPVFRCVDSFTRLNPICGKGLSAPRSDMESYRGPTVQALQTLRTKYPGLEIWDPLPVLCGDLQCDALRDGRPLFFDADHVSGYGNVLLYPSFLERLDSLSAR